MTGWGSIFPPAAGAVFLMVPRLLLGGSARRTHSRLSYGARQGLVWWLIHSAGGRERGPSLSSISYFYKQSRGYLRRKRAVLV